MKAILIRLRSLLRKRLDSDLTNEMSFHLEMAIEDYVASGMTRDEARAQAVKDFGNRTALKELGHDMFAFPRLETFLQDIRYGVRVLIKNPGFTLTAMITLALGIGVNVAIFSLVYGVLMRPLPYESGERLVVLHQQASRTNANNVPFSVKEITDYRENSHTLDAVVEHHTMNFLLFDNDSAERVNTAVVSANFFDVLGVKPLLGRTFVASDDTPNSDAVLILSNEYWTGRYGADPTVIGRVFQLNNRPHRVIGVLPPIPQYPVANDVYMPTWQCPTRASAPFIANRQSRMMTAFGRLKPGVSVEQAQADLAVVAQQMEKSNPDAYPATFGYKMAIAALREDLTRRAQSTFLVLLAAAGLVLLIACANVANLMLARLVKLQKEISLRVALGAGKIRLIRQLLTESMILSLAGGALGLALAPSTLRLLVKFAERFTTRASEIKIDAPILFFAVLISLVTGLLFGLWPAFSSSRNVSSALQQGTARTTEGRASQRLRGGLVVAQIAVSFVLLIGAGLTIRSFIKLIQVNPGFAPARLLTLRISPSFTHYTQAHQFRTLTDSVLRNVGSVNGVESVSLTTNFPFNPSRVIGGPASIGFRIEGRTASANEPAMLVDRNAVTPAYFDTIHQPILQGRLFTEHDDAKALGVALINQTMARHRWPSEDPIGKRISFDSGSTWIQVAGIVGDIKEYGLDRAVGDVVYLPVAQIQNGFASNLVVRTAADPMSVFPAVRAAIRAVDPQLALDRVNTVEGFEQETIASPKVVTMLLGLFAILALVISASGIAAVMALSVSQRTNEIGIRMALGASRESVIYMVVRQGLTMAIIGTAIGVAGALALTRLASTLLYDTSPTDVLTFVATALLFLLVAATACLIPARQITGIDPLNALRQE